MKIEDTTYYQFKRANIAAFKVWREIEKIIKPILMPLIDKLNTLLLKYQNKVR